MLNIKFKGVPYLLIGDKETGGAIATREQYENGTCSYTHLGYDEKVRRYREIIGSIDDIEFLDEVKDKDKPDLPNILNLLTDQSWNL